MISLGLKGVSNPQNMHIWLVKVNIFVKILRHNIYQNKFDKKAIKSEKLKIYV